MEVVWSLKPVDIFTILALILGPISAVGITLWAQKREREYGAKERLFMTLMSHRKLPPTAEWASALNLIDVVYADHPKVLEYWEQLYDQASLQQAGTQKWNHAYLNMLQNMGLALGYKRLTVTDIDRFYFPESLGKQAERVATAQDELIRVLRASKSFSTDFEDKSS